MKKSKKYCKKAWKKFYAGKRLTNKELYAKRCWDGVVLCDILREAITFEIDKQILEQMKEVAEAEGIPHNI